MNNVVIRLPIILTYAMFLGFIAGCVAPQIRNGELFVATRRQFSLVNEAWHANDSRMNPGAVLAPFAMVGGSIIGVTYAPVADFLCIPYDMNIRKKGRLVRILDEHGHPAEGVDVVLVLGGGIDVICGRTNIKGELDTKRIIDNAIYETSLREFRLSGKGYYNSEWHYNRFPFEKSYKTPVVDGAQPLELSIKRIVKPVPMTYGNAALPHTKIKSDKPFEYDCEYCDWLPPYGIGKTADLRIEQKVSCPDTSDGRITNVFSVVAIGEGNGLCRGKYDTWSLLGSDNFVPDDANFSCKSADAIYVFDKSGRWLKEESRPFDWGEYYMLRLRSEINSEGKVVHARFGKLVFVAGMGSRFQTYLNCNVDERSIEAQRAKNPAALNNRAYRNSEIYWP